MKIKGKQLEDTLRSESTPFDIIYADRTVGDLNGAVRFTAVNDTGAAIAKGKVVALVENLSGNLSKIVLADADGTNTMPAFGLTAQSSVGNGDEVDVITFGNLKGIDTSTLDVGDTLYVSTTAGEYTTTAPTGSGAKIQNIGMVVKSDSNGIIKVGGAGRSNATPNLDEGHFFLGNASNQSVQSSYQLPTSIGTSGYALTSNGTDLVFSEIGGGSPTVITANTGLAANTEYVISNAVSSTLVLSVPLAGGGYTPAIGDTIKIRNTTDNDIIIQRYSTTSANYNTLRFWNGDVVPNVGATIPYNRYKELTIEGKGEITLINQDGGGSYVDWWVHHSPAVEWEIDSIGTNGALYYDATKRAVSILGQFNPPNKELTSNITGAVQPASYFTNYNHGEDVADTDYTILLPDLYNYNSYATALSGAGFFFIENRGSKLIKLGLTDAYIFVSSTNSYYYAYIKDIDGNNLVSNDTGRINIYSGEKIKIEVSYETSPYNQVFYKIIRYPQDTRVIKDSSASNATITAERERELIYIVKNSSTPVTITLPSVITDTSSPARKEGYKIKIKRTGSEKVTVVPSSGDTIDGTSSLELNTSNQAVTFTSDTSTGAGWWTV